VTTHIKKSGILKMARENLLNCVLACGAVVV